MAPNRDVLIVTGAEDRRGLQRMGEIAAEVLRQPRPLSAEVLQHGQRMASYQEQKQLLEALHKKTGEDVFVATYYATKQKDTGVVTSYSTWTQGESHLMTIPLLVHRDCPRSVVPTRR